MYKYMYCASVSYPVTEGGIFNIEYFINKHVPMFVHFLGENCLKFEVQKCLEQPSAPKPIYICTGYFWVQSGELFGEALADHGKEIYSDIPKFTNIEPIRQWNEVIA